MTKLHMTSQIAHPERREMLAGVAGLALSLATPWSRAQQDHWPSRPIRFVVNFPPGSSPDVLARALTQPLQQSLGQSVVVENRPGANGLVGGEAVVKASDQHTFLVTAGSTITTNPFLYPKMPFDVSRDLLPVAGLARITLFLVVRPELGVRNLQEFVALLKNRPGKLSYGSAGNGSGMHLAGELFKSQAGVFAVHVPYRGAAPALQDLLAGQIDFLFDPGISLSHVRAGKLVLLAVATQKRSPAFPDVMTMDEGGLLGFDAGTTHGVYAPASTRPEVVARLNTEINRALQLPTVRTQVTSIGADPSPMSISQYVSVMEADSLRYARIIRERHIQGD
jgi:tripartite-type tricarboxylate transporter receptor subunit TctC